MCITRTLRSDRSAWTQCCTRECLACDGGINAISAASLSVSWLKVSPSWDRSTHSCLDGFHWNSMSESSIQVQLGVRKASTLTADLGRRIRANSQIWTVFYHRYCWYVQKYARTRWCVHSHLGWLSHSMTKQTWRMLTCWQSTIITLSTQSWSNTLLETLGKNENCPLYITNVDSSDRSDIVISNLASIVTLWPLWSPSRVRSSSDTIHRGRFSCYGASLEGRAKFWRWRLFMRFSRSLTY